MPANPRIAHAEAVAALERLRDLIHRAEQRLRSRALDALECIKVRATFDDDSEADLRRLSANLAQRADEYVDGLALADRLAAYLAQPASVEDDAKAMLAAMGAVFSESVMRNDVNEFYAGRVAEEFRRRTTTRRTGSFGWDVLATKDDLAQPAGEAVIDATLPTDAYMEQMEAHRDEGGTITSSQRFQLAWWQREKQWRKKWAEAVDLCGARAVRIAELEASSPTPPAEAQPVAWAVIARDGKVACDKGGPRIFTKEPLLWHQASADEDLFPLYRSPSLALAGIREAVSALKSYEGMVSMVEVDRLLADAEGKR